MGSKVMRIWEEIDEQKNMIKIFHMKKFKVIILIYYHFYYIKLWMGDRKQKEVGYERKRRWVQERKGKLKIIEERGMLFRMIKMLQEISVS